MKTKFLIYALFFMVSGALFAQDTKAEETVTKAGHKNNNKFKQLYEEFATPNRFRTASGAPGIDYYQQQVDYVMDIELDDENTKLYGEETITYTNNSPDALTYIWVQLEQNIRRKDAPALEKNPSKIDPIEINDVDDFVKDYLKKPFDGGFNIEFVKDANGKALPYIINQTMMRIDLPTPIQKGQQYVFSIKWWYNVNNHVTNRARSGFEYFPEDDNRAYVIAQFFPRVAVYNDVEGWQNYQFWGNGEFALNFGDYDVSITVPADHIMEATGVLQNPKDVLSRKEMQRYNQAKESFDAPVLIVTQEEAEAKEAEKSTKKSTWKFKAKNVRDFGFATSRRFIWDMMAVKVGGKNVIASSLYPKEGNPLWEEYSTKVVAHSLEVYSKYTFDYPYPKAVSVHAKNQGMEYPMICWNYGRPNEDGTYSDRIKYGMISVIIHEVGHNFFPMIVNSDERQWGWMDEGLDTFIQYLTEQELEEDYPSRRGKPSKIVRYMSGDQEFISPIMSNPENVYKLGPNAYGKPATALNILRETIMGPELFDHAFKTYSQRWMFKHPTPEDFFRTMEDASAVDLDWFWRGWFYSTDVVDIGVKSFERYHVTTTPPKDIKELTDILESLGLDSEEDPSVYLISESPEDSEDFRKDLESQSPEDIKAFLKENDDTLEEGVEVPKYFYQIEFEKPGGIVMPIIVEYAYADGTKKTVKYPVQVWRKNDASVKKVITSDKEIVGVTIDPKAETADVNLANNSWPKKDAETDFSKFKETLKN